MRKLIAIMVLSFLAGCQTPEEGVVNKVLADFGLRERPEGYVSGSDSVEARLDGVGNAELKRLNFASRQGEVKFEQDGIRGLYYKEVKVYEDFAPLDAQPVNKTSMGERGYAGYIQFTYRLHQSERKSNKAEALAATADIPVGEPQHEVYRYTFGPAGAWNGAEGELTKR